MEILDEDFYELVANNKFLKQNLENEIRGFAIYLVNGNNLDIINSCSEYSKHKDIESLCEEINEICHNFAKQFYDREFTDQQIEGFQESSGLPDVFKSFSQTGNIVLFKNQLLNLLKEESERFDTQQTSNFGYQKNYSQMDNITMKFSNQVTPGQNELEPMGSPLKKRRNHRIQQNREVGQATNLQKEPTVTIPHVFAMIQQFDFLNEAQKEYINQSIANEDQGIHLNKSFSHHITLNSHN